jgi:hypothetical protein
MRKTLVIAVAAAAMIGATALPASAADTGTNFVLAAGTLSMTVPGTATLTPGTVGSSSVTGSLGTVSVSDQRGAATGWIVNAVSAPFVNGAAVAVSGAVTYSAGPATVDGVVFTPALATVITGSLPVGAGVAPGSNTASFNPTITVALPSSGNVIGNYVGIVTTSIA